MTLHNALANSELHEDKGVAEATDMEAYVSDGGGSGAWASPVVEVVGTWDYSTDVSSIDFEGLGDYALLQIDLVGITTDSATNQWVHVRVGNDSGFENSSVYHCTYWDSHNVGNSLLSALGLGLYKNSTPAAGLNFSSCFLTNFNIGRYKTAVVQASWDESTTTPTAFRKYDWFIRNNEAMNKLRIACSNDFTGGSIVISGYRYKV